MSAVNNTICILEINIDDLKKEKLEIKLSDNAHEISSLFCQKHNLEDIKKIYLMQLIQDKINENLEKITHPI